MKGHKDKKTKRQQESLVLWCQGSFALLQCFFCVFSWSTIASICGKNWQYTLWEKNPQTYLFFRSSPSSWTCHGCDKEENAINEGEKRNFQNYVQLANSRLRQTICTSDAQISPMSQKRPTPPVTSLMLRFVISQRRLMLRIDDTRQLQRQWQRQRQRQWQRQWQSQEQT